LRSIDACHGGLSRCESDFAQRADAAARC
jgi:hypothetical protein